MKWQQISRESGMTLTWPWKVKSGQSAECKGNIHSIQSLRGRLISQLSSPDHNNPGLQNTWSSDVQIHIVKFNHRTRASQRSVLISNTLNRWFQWNGKFNMTPLSWLLPWSEASQGETVLIIMLYIWQLLPDLQMNRFKQGNKLKKQQHILLLHILIMLFLFQIASWRTNYKELRKTVFLSLSLNEASSVCITSCVSINTKAARKPKYRNNKLVTKTPELKQNKTQIWLNGFDTNMMWFFRHNYV